jgi:hypothetical protein
MPGRVLFASVVSAWALAVLYWGCGGTPPPTADPWIVLYRNGLLADRGAPLGTLLPDGRFLDLDGIARVTVT